MPLIAPVSTWSLKTKLALSSGALMFVFAVAFTSWTLRQVEEDVRRSVADNQRALVRSTANDIEDKVELRRDALITIARLLGAAAPAPGAPMDEFFKPRPVLQKMFDVVLVVDAKGHVLYDLPHDAATGSTGIEVGDSAYFRQIMAGTPLVISTPQKSVARGEPLIVFGAPLHAPDGSVRGALLCALNLSRPNFLGRLSEVRIGREGYFALISRTAPPMYVLHKDRALIMTPAPGGNEHPIMNAAQKEQEIAIEGPGARGLDALRTALPLRTVPWVLTAVYPTAEAYAGLQERRRDVLGFGAAMFAVAALLSWLLSVWMLRPLSQLREMMERHAVDPGQHMPEGNFGSLELSALVTAYKAQAVARRDYQQRLDASEQHMRAVTDNMPALIACIDADQRYRFLNATFATWLGIDHIRSIGERMEDVIGTEVYASRLQSLQACLAGRRISFEADAKTRLGTKRLQIEYIPDLKPDGSVVGMYTLAYDVTALKEAQDELARLVRYDSLTGLHNRYQLNESLPLAIARSTRSGEALGLMFLDIDHFKKINDSLGHATGDAVLREFALRLLRAVRTTDTVARLGGDEFVVIMEGLNDESAARGVARKVLAEIAPPFSIYGRTVMVTACVGVAFHHSGRINAKELLAKADAALYEAKAAGRNDFRVAAG